MIDAKQAEQLWITAHEHVKQGNLAQAVRDLAACYEGLKALKDPRLAQVHKRWVEVHKLYQERKARAKAAAPQGPATQPAGAAAQAVATRQTAPQAAAPQAAAPQAAAQHAAVQHAAVQPAAVQPAAVQPAAVQPAAVKADEPIRVEPRFSQAEARTLGEQAEAAANAGNLEQALALYTRVVAESPTNELAKERLAELRAAAARKTEMSGPQERAPHIASSLPASQPMVDVPAANSGKSFPPGADGDVAFLQALLQQVHERGRAG